MARDLEEFLRRAAQRRNQQQTGQPPRAPAREPVVELELADEPRSLGGQPSSVHSQRSPSLGSSHGTSISSVDMADERMDEHLHDSFDHGLGDLAAPTKTLTASDSGTNKAAAQTVIQEIIEMLGDPSGIQKAVILKEILDRPVSRWN